MNAPAPHSVVVEINRLYDEAQRLTAESRTSLHAALAAAWSAGRLLLEEKKRVHRLMGGGAWLLWLEQNFRGTPRTAQNYMRLAREITDVATLHGLSLRQTYFQLGIATEPKSLGGDSTTTALPSHIRLANRLLVALKSRPGRRRTCGPEQAEAYRRDLRALYEHLQRLFAAAQPETEAHTEVNFSPARVSKSTRP